MGTVIQLVPAPAVDPRDARHDAMVADIAKRVSSIGGLIAHATALHRSDESKQLQALRRQLDLEMQRLEFACDDAWELAGE